MRILPSRQKHRSAIDIVARWWREWGETDSRLAEPPSCLTERMVPLSEDLGLSATDFRAAASLRALAGYGPDEATLLPRRMTMLQLDPDEVARLEPGVFRHLYWRCMLCQSPGQCALDLADDSPITASQELRHDYCPNAATLRWLREMPWFCSATESSRPREVAGP
jgi:hypothetical protein